jgi:hypothetical protein
LQNFARIVAALNRKVEQRASKTTGNSFKIHKLR